MDIGLRKRSFGLRRHFLHTWQSFINTILFALLELDTSSAREPANYFTRAHALEHGHFWIASRNGRYRPKNWCLDRYQYIFLISYLHKVYHSCFYCIFIYVHY